MKRLYIVVLGAIVVSGVTYMYLHRQELGLAAHWGGNSDVDLQPQPANIAWTSVDRSAEGFKLDMPADQREIEVPAYNESGSAEPVALLYSYPDPSTSFSVSWADEPPVMRAVAGNAEQALDDARDGALARTQTVLVSEAQSTRQGFPVRDFVARNPNGGVFNARMVLAGSRLYMLMASFPAASARRDADVNHFFDSFRVVSTTPGK